MNKALDIARYIINYSIDLQKPISHLKLQKILFYIQAAFLVEKDTPAFCEEIVNWTYGPVVPEVYNSFKQYGYQDIYDKILSTSEMVLDPETLDISFDETPFNDAIIEEDSKLIIKNIVTVYKEDSAIKMMKKTHQEDPWKDTENGQIIELNKIQDYYLKNLNKLYNS